MSERVLGGRYVVQDKVGTGGMATVYRGLDNVLGRTVAIKTMLPQYAADASFAARFKQEAQAAAALQSPYIVSVYDWGKDGDTYYIIMEYLRGTDLKSGIRKHGALDCKKVAQIGSQIAQALSVAHKHEIIHRDIKPQNIMVQPDGNVKVMDFGIARAKNSHLTADDSVLGTAHYVSPEQTQGKELGPTTDIYSLGIVMYEAATGKVPFDGDDAISVALKQVNEQPKPPSQLNPDVDLSLEAVILKCMQKNPAARFQTAEELYHALRDYLGGRLQAVNNAAAVVTTPTVLPTIAPASGTQTIARPRIDNGTGRGTGALGTGSLGTGAIGQTNRHASLTATHLAQLEEEKAYKRRRRWKRVGIFLVIVALALMCVGAYRVLAGSGTREVPDLVGMTEEAAHTEIDDTAFFKQGQTTREYSDTEEEGTVMDQTPSAGSERSKGTTIDIVVSKGPEEKKSVTVPDLTGMSAAEAATALSSVGLKGKAGETVYSSDVESNKVAAQSPTAGSTAKQGDTVTYQLSKGAESVDVPYVIGMYQDAATQELQSAGFSVEVTSAHDSSDSGMVIDQSTTDKAKKGTTVTITVSSGPQQTSVPSVVWQTQNAATQTLQASGFSVNVETTASSATKGVVVDQDPASGTYEDDGATVTIYVSDGSQATDNGSHGDHNTSGSGDNTSDTTDDTTDDTTSTEDTTNSTSTNSTTSSSTS